MLIERGVENDKRKRLLGKINGDSTQNRLEDMVPDIKENDITRVRPQSEKKIELIKEELKRGNAMDRRETVLYSNNSDYNVSVSYNIGNIPSVDSICSAVKPRWLGWVLKWAATVYAAEEQRTKVLTDTEKKIFEIAFTIEIKATLDEISNFSTTEAEDIDISQLLKKFDSDIIEKRITDQYSSLCSTANNATIIRALDKNVFSISSDSQVEDKSIEEGSQLRIFDVMESLASSYNIQDIEERTLSRLYLLQESSMFLQQELLRKSQNLSTLLPLSSLDEIMLKYIRGIELVSEDITSGDFRPTIRNTFPNIIIEEVSEPLVQNMSDMSDLSQLLKNTFENTANEGVEKNSFAEQLISSYFEESSFQEGITISRAGAGRFQVV